jgi:hypothetical protein
MFRVSNVFYSRSEINHHFVLRWKATMRRAISILLLALLCFPSLSSAFTQSSSDESRLPACCRRDGKHHCAMSEEMIGRVVVAISGKTPTVGAPAHCPFYPTTQNATLTPIFVVTPQSASLPAHYRTERISVARITRASVTIIGAHTVRGPPAAALA